MSLEQLISNLALNLTGPFFNSNESNSSSIMRNLTEYYTPLPEWCEVLWWVGFSCIWPPAIALNFMVCWIILTDKTMRKKVTNYPLLNLAVADLLTSIFNTPFNFYFMLHNNWIWSELWCSVNEFLSCLFIAASVFTLTAISIDRYLVLAKAFAFPQSKGVMFAAALAIWIASTIISSPVYYYYDRFPVSPDSPKYRCMWNDYFPDSKHYYNISFMVFTYFVPIIFMGYCYTCVCKKLWCAEVIGERNESQRRMHEDRKRMVIMLIVVVTSFAICWLPTHVYFMVVDHWPELRRDAYTQYIYLFFFWLAMSNNMMNPLIYFVVLPNFRRRFMQILGRCVGRGGQRDRAVGIDRGRGFAAPESSRKTGLSMTGVTIATFTVSNK